MLLLLYETSNMSRQGIVWLEFLTNWNSLWRHEGEWKNPYTTYTPCLLQVQSKMGNEKGGEIQFHTVAIVEGGHDS